jgi:hypothetical protein
MFAGLFASFFFEILLLIAFRFVLFDWFDGASRFVLRFMLFPLSDVGIGPPHQRAQQQNTGGEGWLENQPRYFFGGDARRLESKIAAMYRRDLTAVSRYQ